MQVVIKPPRPANRLASDVLREFYEAYNRRDWEALTAALHPAIEWFHAGRHELLRGAEGVVGMLRASAEAFPNARIELRALRDAEDVVVAEWTVESTRGSDTSEKKPAIVCEVIEVQNGRILRGSTYGDILTMMMEFREEYRPPLRAVC